MVRHDGSGDQEPDSRHFEFCPRSSQAGGYYSFSQKLYGGSIMPRQKKSALPAATVQSTQGNIIHVQFKTRTCKSQEGKIISLADFGRKKKCSLSNEQVKRMLNGEKCNPISREQALRMFLELRERASVRCPESSVKMVREAIARAKGGAPL